MVLNSINTGFFSYDGGSLFGVAPKLAWSEFYPCDGDNRCKLALRSLLVQTEGRNILVDTGVGLKHADVMEQFGFFGLKNIAEEVQKCGCRPDEVTDVVLTNLHFEHCGGTTFIDFSEKVMLTFPNATVHVAERQWLSLMDPNERERCMFIPVDVMEAMKQDKLHVLKADEQLCPGVELKLFDGNTSAQVVPYITDGDRTFVFAGDLVPTGVHVRLDWLDAHDVEPLKAIAAKRQILDEALQGGHWLIFPHDARFPCARIAKGEDYHICEVGGVADRGE